MNATAHADPWAAAHELLLHLRLPSEPQLSPDGQLAAFVVAGPGNQGDARVHLLPAGGGGAPRALPAPDGTSQGCPRWSADGRVIFAAHGGTGAEAHVLIAVEARTGAWLWQLPVPGAIEDVIVAGAHVVVRVADPGSERDGMHLGLRVAGPDDPYVDRPGLRWRRLAVIGTRSPDLRLIDLPGWTVWDAGLDASGRILAVAARDPRPSGYYQPTLLLTDLHGTGPRQLVDSAARQLSRPRLAAGRRHGYVVQGLSIVSGRVLRVDLDSGEVQPIPGLDDVTDLGFLPDGRAWFAGWTGDGVQAGLLGSGGGIEVWWKSPGAVTGRDGQPSLSVDTAGQHAVAVWEDGTHPPEVARTPLAGPAWQALTALNKPAVGAAHGIRREWATWKAPGGPPVHGLLLSPEDAGGPLPLVVIVHGGPTWLSPDSFAPAEAGGLALPLTAAGAAVLLPNPRGSSGRGQPYAEAVIGAMGEADLTDLLAGVDALVGRGVADPARLSVMGLSYGGYLAAWALARTSRFRAGVAMSAVADWVSFGQTSNLADGYDRVYHPGADPATTAGRELLVSRSPARQVTGGAAPLLILHGEKDRVTPLGQAEQLRHAWAAAGNQVELVVYPREGHELTEIGHRRDAAARVLGWLRKNQVIADGAGG